MLHELFECHAEAHPGRVAVVCRGNQITYAQIEQRANRMARWLRQRGVGPGDCVGLWLPRSETVYPALLGVLKAGAAYVPLDPEYPAQRVAFILDDCQARMLLTTSGLAARLRAEEEQEAEADQKTRTKFAAEIIALDECRADIESQRADKLGRTETGVNVGDLCYIIYTSGTTGRPKGVMIEHRSVCHLVRAEAEIFRVRPEDRVFQGFSLAFDASVEEIWLAFASGAALAVGTEEMMRAGPALARMLTEAGITILSCVPTLLSMIEEDIPSLRLLILGGEACPQELVRRWCKPGRQVVNTYGPTEATVIATWAECDPDNPVTIGKPLPGYEVFILDELQKPLPAGEAGELCLGGVGLARGYVGLPELTREKFVNVRVLSDEGRVSRVEGSHIEISTGARPSSGAASLGGDGAPQNFEACCHANVAAPEDRRAPAPVAQRLYRTGDLARVQADGEIEFLGRLDSQVKIRGFRVELSEIEAVLMECDGVKAAAVALREERGGLMQLAGYLVPKETAVLQEQSIRAKLRERLPGYMVPAFLETLPGLPTLPSGKVDRCSLPEPRCRQPVTERAGIAPRTAREQQLAAAWERLFAPSPVALNDDFFRDLGGHSLLAASLVSELRKTPQFAELSMLDVYRHPTIEALASELERRRLLPPHPGPLPLGGGEGASPAARPSSIIDHPSSTCSVPFWRHFWCGAAQALSLLFILTFFALQWLAPYLTYTLLIEEEYDFLQAVLGAFASLILFYPLMLIIPIAAKWLVVGRYKSGAYPLWGSYYFRWWLVTTIEAAVPVAYLSGTPLLGIYLRLMGAKIGPNVHLGSDSFAIYDLLSIGASSSINADAKLLGYTVEDGLLKLGRITIGERCFVGVRATLREETLMKDDSALDDLSLLPRGATVPSGQTWAGSPAAECRGARDEGRGSRDERRVASFLTLDSRPSSPVSSLVTRFFFGVLHAIGLLIFPVLVVAALFPGIVVMNELNYIDPYYWYLLLAPLVGLSFVVLLCLEIAAVKWLLLGKVKAGNYSISSFYYLRKWFFDQMMDLSLDVIGPLYASVYLTPWYKLLGAKLGRGAEISTASFISPDLLSIGAESFIADNVSLGAPRVRDGSITIGNNRIGNRSFIGNSALLPPGTAIGDSVLIGCLSVPPLNPADALREDGNWMGSPAIFLPQRQKSGSFSRATTFDPPARLRAARALIEFIRVITPSTCFIILISLLFSSILLLRDQFSVARTLLLFPILYLACGLAAAAVVIAAKWALVWRYLPGEKPLWSTFVWRNELLNALHEHLAEPFLIGPLTGTPFVCWYFRLLGARIGRRVYMETTDFSEFDLATIGDETALNADCTIQTHLFEDRVMKMSTIQIGPRCKVGAASVILYDARMEEGASLDDLSLLMKGEVLPAATKWQGIPARSE